MTDASNDPALLVEGLPLTARSTIAGKYRVDRVLGAGGMGVILAGHHVALDQQVAIKVLKPGALEDPELVARFAREARAAARLRSPHVARVLDVGEAESGLPYMVMEYLSGKDLSQLLRDQGPLPIETATDYLLQACEGLAEAHRAGIIHRDLKPANLFLTSATDGSALVKVLDFGISKLVSRPDDAGPSEGLTQTQTMMGSPHYMSPEQLRSARQVDARTDIWSLGAVLFKLLTNEPAFDAASTPELCVAILVSPTRGLRQLRPDIPPELESIVQRCLEKDPTLRYASVGELARALAPFASPEAATSVARIERVGSSPNIQVSAPSSSPIPAGTPAPVPVGETSTMTASAASLPTPDTDGTDGASARSAGSRRRVVQALGATVAVVLVAVAGVAFTTRRDAGPPPQSAAGLVAPAASVAPSSAPVASVEPAPSLVIGALTTPSSSASAAPATAAPSSSAARTIGRPIASARPAARAPASATPPKPTAPAEPPASTSNVPDFGGRK